MSSSSKRVHRRRGAAHPRLGRHATLAVAGQQLRLQVDRQARVAGFRVSLRELAAQQAVVRVSQGGGESGG